MKNLNLLFLLIEVFVNKGYSRRVVIRVNQSNRVVKQRLI